MVNGWVLFQRCQALSSMAKLAVLLALLVSEARNSSAAALIGFVDTPVSANENNPGSTRPSVVMPTNGCASAASARASVWVTNGVSGDGRCRPDNGERSRMPNGIAIVGVAIFSPGASRRRRTGQRITGPNLTNL